MAPNEEKTLIIKERELTGGHNVYYTDSVLNLASLKTHRFRHDFRTACDVLSTSWKFDLVYQEITEKNELTFSVALLRDDFMKTNVDAYIWLQICDSHGCPIYPPKVFRKGDMFPGDAIEETALRVRPLPRRSILQNEEVVVSVTIMVRFCHSHSDE